MRIASAVSFVLSEDQSTQLNVPEPRHVNSSQACGNLGFTPFISPFPAHLIQPGRIPPMHPSADTPRGRHGLYTWVDGRHNKQGTRGKKKKLNGSIQSPQNTDATDACRQRNRLEDMWLKTTSYRYVQKRKKKKSGCGGTWVCFSTQVIAPHLSANIFAQSNGIDGGYPRA